MLHRGDTFGEAGLLEETTRIATVRASSAVQVLRLHRQRLRGARTRRIPEVRAAFEGARAHAHALRTSSGSTPASRSLPNEALAELVSGLERVDGARRRAGRRARAIRPGRCTWSRRAGCAPSTSLDGRRARSRVPAQGRLLRRALALPGRAARRDASRRSTTARCSASRRSSSRGSSTSTRTSARGWRSESRQYDYRRLARVPLDFADEILPAEASVADGFVDGAEALAPEPPQVEELAGRAGAGEAPDGAGRRFPHIFQLDEMDCGAACLAMVCRYYGRAVSLSHIREVAHTSDARDVAERDHARRGGARARRAVDPRLEEPARRAAAAGGRPLAGQPLGRRSTASRQDHVRVADPETRPAPPHARRSSSRTGRGYASVIALRRGPRAAAGGAGRASAGSSRSCGRT